MLIWLQLWDDKILSWKKYTNKYYNIFYIYFPTTCFDDWLSVHVVVLNWQTRLFKSIFAVSGQSLAIYLFSNIPFQRKFLHEVYQQKMNQTCVFGAPNINDIQNICFYWSIPGMNNGHWPYSECHLCWGVNILIFPKGRWCLILHSSELPTGRIGSSELNTLNGCWRNMG